MDLEEIDKRRTTNFKVTKIPVEELKKFKKLCKEEYGDIYFVGIIQLMKTKENHERLLKIIEKVDSNSKIRGEASPHKPKTFGDKNE